MTLLITAVGSDYVLACSDTRISIQKENRFIPVDEKFNKHILFSTNGMKFNISYTGVARWNLGGKQIRLYDLICNILVSCSKSNLKFGGICLALIEGLTKQLNNRILKNKNGNLILELHIVGFVEGMPLPFIGVISTFRTQAPWNSSSDLTWEFDLGVMKLFYKAFNKPEVIVGGMAQHVRESATKKILEAATNGADAYNISRLAAKTIRAVSKKTKSVGARSVSVVIPANGFIDTNLWESKKEGIIAFLPCIVGPNGFVIATNEFPVDMSLLTSGYLPRNGIFFKSIVDESYKRAHKRVVFANKKGRALPGILGLLGLALYGEAPDGYTDFGLND